MNSDEVQWLRDAADSRKDLKTRITVLEHIGQARDPSLIPELKRLLSRTWPSAEPDLENWDPPGAERVVDLHILLALHGLGDDSEVARLPRLVAEAQPVLQGPYEELAHAIGAIRILGDIKVVLSVAELGAGDNPRIVENAVRILDALDLPARPVAQNLGAVPWTEEQKVTVTIHRLKEELDRLVALSNGKLLLSDEVSHFAATHDYSRGEVQRENRPFGEIIEREMRQLGFDYYVEDGRVLLCTYIEAGKRWARWRMESGPHLSYSRELERFVVDGGAY